MRIMADPLTCQRSTASVRLAFAPANRGDAGLRAVRLGASASMAAMLLEQAVVGATVPGSGGSGVPAGVVRILVYLTTCTGIRWPLQDY